MAMPSGWPRSRPGRYILAAICFALTTLYFYRRNSRSILQRERISSGTASQKGRLHLLIPATSSNLNLCKLVLSTSILDYPAPVFINWGAAEDRNAYKQHLAKVETILSYLDGLQPSSEYEEDLVLIVDGYDVWFQLPPDVLIKRYYALNQAADARTIETYGREVFKQHDMRQTLIFNNDKICWPIDHSRPACWAVSTTNLDPYAFGPETSTSSESRNQPRWLNSGTIIGPLQDMKDMFRETLHMIQTNHTTDSDQFYFSNVFARQEYSRLTRRPDLLESYKQVRYEKELLSNKTLHREVPDISGRTEFHMGIDYAAETFQTLAFWHQYLTWIKPSNGWNPSQQAIASGDVERYRMSVPQDLQESPGPMHVLGGSFENASWADQELSYNSVTSVIPVGVHFTGEKQFREIWWERIWFQRKAEILRIATLQFKSTNKLYESPIQGKMWYGYEPTYQELDGISGKHSPDGGWSDDGTPLSWDTICKIHEPGLYDRKSDRPLTTTSSSTTSRATPSGQSQLKVPSQLLPTEEGEPSKLLPVEQKEQPHRET